MAVSERLAHAEMQKSKVAICNPTFNQATKVSESWQGGQAEFNHRIQQK